MSPFDLLSPWQWACLGSACRQFNGAIRQKAQATPYTHLIDPDGSMYMGRYWLFNAYPAFSDQNVPKYPELPSVRVHHICREDRDRHLHNHPWDAVSIILKGWYVEEREGGIEHRRTAGVVTNLKADTYHRITEVSPGGVWTLFITGNWQQKWGFQTDEGFVHWREYLGIPDTGEKA